MKITFLGVWMASDVGETVSFVIDCDSGERILVDCGTNLVDGLNKAGIDPSSITHIIVTHTHGDHISGLPSYLFYRIIYAPGIFKKEVNKLQIVSSKDSLTKIQNYIDIPYDVLTYHPSIQYISCDTLNNLQIANVSFRFFESCHKPLTYGFVCKASNGKSFVYSADTAFDEKIISFAAQTDCLIHDVAATHEYTPLAGGHTLCSQISAALEKYNIKCFIPVHRISVFKNNIEQYLSEIKENYSGRIIIPDDGTVINL